MKSYKGFAFITGKIKPKILEKNVIYLGSVLLNKVYK